MNQAMDDLIDRAERDGLWLFCAYQQLWFSPQQLREAQRNGRFRWGAVNWRLRDPRERLAQAEHEATAAVAHLESVRRDVLP